MSGAQNQNPTGQNAGPPVDKNDPNPKQVTKPEETMTKPHYERGEPLQPMAAGFSHERDLQYSADKRHVLGPRQMPADPFAAGLHIGVLNGGTATETAMPAPPKPPHTGADIHQFNADPASAGPDANYVRAVSPETSRPF